MSLLETYECTHQRRERRRRAADQARLVALVTALVCDLAHRHLTALGGWVSLSLSNDDLSGRYTPPFMTGKVRTVLNDLASSGLRLIEREKGVNGPRGIARRTT